VGAPNGSTDQSTHTSVLCDETPAPVPFPGLACWVSRELTGKNFALLRSYTALVSEHGHRRRDFSFMAGHVLPS